MRPGSAFAARFGFGGDVYDFWVVPAPSERTLAFGPLGDPQAPSKDLPSLGKSMREALWGQWKSSRYGSQGPISHRSQEFLEVEGS